ncbi:MAG TPA: hypothetical protein VFE62_24825 [Gemmataceae bacterium]|nr:hypothetical protein [Gemmataceae bacterium]
MRRIHQAVLLASTLTISWLGMMAVHEAGHVLAAWLTGATVVRVVLHPLTISRTDIGDNPHPLVVVAAGPLVGVAAPLFAWLMARVPIWYLFRFFAGFCLIANGAYIGAGSFESIGDAGELLRHGASMWQLWLFGAICVPTGLALWHRLGVHFGLGEARGSVSTPTAYGCLMVALVMITLMALFGGE